MVRRLGVVALATLLAACPSYDRYGRIADESGLVPPDQFARYGSEQAQAIALGRAFGASYTGSAPADFGRQVAQAVEYARTLPDVADVQTDSSAKVLTVTFRSGWRKAVTPITDGVPADQTTGLPARRQ